MRRASRTATNGARVKYTSVSLPDGIRDQLGELKNMLNAGGKKIWFMTGAGVSVSTGIPGYDDDSREKMKFATKGDFKLLNIAITPMVEVLTQQITMTPFYRLLRDKQALLYDCVTLNIDNLSSVFPLTKELHGSVSTIIHSEGGQGCTATCDPADYFSAILLDPKTVRCVACYKPLRPKAVMYDDDPLYQSLFMKNSELIDNPFASEAMTHVVAVFVGLSFLTDIAKNMLAKAYKAAESKKIHHRIYIINTTEVDIEKPKATTSRVEVVHLLMSADDFADFLLA